MKGTICCLEGSGRGRAAAALPARVLLVSLSWDGFAAVLRCTDGPRAGGVPAAALPQCVFALWGQGWGIHTRNCLLTPPVLFLTAPALQVRCGAGLCHQQKGKLNHVPAAKCLGGSSRSQHPLSQCCEGLREVPQDAPTQRLVQQCYLGVPLDPKFLGGVRGSAHLGKCQWVLPRASPAAALGISEPHLFLVPFCGAAVCRVAVRPGLGSAARAA